MPVKKLNFSIAPLNDNPASVNAGGTTIENGFGSKNGFPTIKFTIPHKIYYWIRVVCILAVS